MKISISLYQVALTHASVEGHRQCRFAHTLSSLGTHAEQVILFGAEASQAVLCIHDTSGHGRPFHAGRFLGLNDVRNKLSGTTRGNIGPLPPKSYTAAIGLDVDDLRSFYGDSGNCAQRKKKKKTAYKQGALDFICKFTTKCSSKSNLKNVSVKKNN